jgi:hypothetical protein
MIRTVVLVFIALLVNTASARWIEGDAILWKGKTCEAILIGKNQVFDYSVMCVKCEVYVMRKENVDSLRKGLPFTYNKRFSRPDVRYLTTVRRVFQPGENYLVLRLNSTMVFPRITYAIATTRKNDAPRDTVNPNATLPFDNSPHRNVGLIVRMVVAALFLTLIISLALYFLFNTIRNALRKRKPQIQTPKPAFNFHNAFSSPVYQRAGFQ